MPRTHFQRVIFTLMTVSLSVVVFIIYNLAIDLGDMNNAIFPKIWKELIFEFPFAFLGQLFIAAPIAKKLAFRVVDPNFDNQRVIVLVITFMTIPIMCSYMSFVSTLHYHGFTFEFVSHWLKAIVFNFPLAVFSQFFFIGPLVRFAFRKTHGFPSPRPGLSRVFSC